MRRYVSADTKSKILPTTIESAVSSVFKEARKITSTDMKKWADDKEPEISDDVFEGTKVVRSDRIGIRFRSTAMGDVGSYAVELVNPNRGSVFFAISDISDFDKIEKSLSSALAAAKKAALDYESKVQKWYKDKRVGKVVKAKKFSPKIMDVLAGTGVQIAYEYPGWGGEHVSDMFATFERRPGFSADDLMDAASLAEKAKREGKKYEEAIEYVKQNWK